MNRNFLIGLAMIGVTGLLIVAGSARRTTMGLRRKDGWVLREPLHHLRFQGADKGNRRRRTRRRHEARSEVQRVHTTLDSKNEPTCVYAPPQGIVAGESEDMGDSTAQSGQRVHAWAVHIGNAAGEWHMLYLEARKEAAPSGDTKSGAI